MLRTTDLKGEIKRLFNVVNLSESYKKRLVELSGLDPSTTTVFYHGTSSVFPFKKFEPKMDGKGIVSNGGIKYGGFFFTDNKEAAEYFTEWFVCKVHISQLKSNPLDVKNPPDVLKQAIVDNSNYLISDLIDGGYHSNMVVVVPMSNVKSINIIQWEFIGDENSYFEALDEKFAPEDGVVSQNLIKSLCRMTNTDFDFLMSIDIFKKYYLSKPEYE